MALRNLNRLRLRHAMFVLAASAAMLSGCAATGGQICVKPPVASEEMQLDRRLSKGLIDDHVYFSKEASSGGRSFGGGGCGCN